MTRGALPRRRVLAGLAALAVSACGSRPGVAPVAGMAVDRETAPEGTVFITSNDWHTGIVVARSDLPADTVPEAADFPDAAWLEFGWGDRDYYPAETKSLGMALAAILTPTPAVVHLSGLPSRPRDVFPTVEVVALRLAPTARAALVRYLHASFDRGDAGRAEAVAPGLYAFSRFYPATGRFHLFNTCNTWTARGLAAAGLAVTVEGTQRAEDLMAQVRALPGARVSPPSR